MYKRICEKLGGEPRSLTFDTPEVYTEDDSQENIFTRLTMEELDFLYENGYV